MSTSTQANGHADTNIPASTPATGSAQQSKIQPNDVGWQFVPQYYNFVNKQPHRLHCFYNKRSTFVHGEEGEESTVALGQQEIHDQITAIGYNECKVYIHSIDSQSSANGGIIILVIGEMSNNHQPWRKFTQTFFLAEQPNGYFVLNDIFRYLKEDVDDEDIPEEEIVSVAPQAQAEQAPAPVEEPVEAKAAEQVTQEAAQAPEPEPEPVSAPAEVKEETVPQEAAVASVPDKDVAPSEPAPAVEEPVTSAPPPAEESPAPTPAPAPAAAKPASPAPAPQAAAPSPAPPAQPAAPPKPKTWASLAASGGKAWSAAVVPNQPAASTAAPAAAAPRKEEAPAAPSAPAAQPGAKLSPFESASRVNTAHCFVKLPNWSVDSQNAGETISENDVKTAASRFGGVKRVEIVKTKACAFVEFAKVESARKAIIASLPASQGGEDGIKIGSGNGKLNFETRKEKDERRGNQNKPQGQQQQGQHQQGNRGPRPQGQVNGGGRGGGRGGRGGARGGQVNQGDRQPKQ
ncbi:uncharacterized protein I303_103763 [Kwoniella dejecticola CBS 10117]|uniref:RAN protein binding protein n=1 Tax=Kwoniella dejecticola CBS 10117 TaxID=1296121 RepID=A0A1A6A7N2_9TREE|nr:uncharacterized protein I303_03781 [Kwoniella dejecticola CBS 10117]OBR86063.1 hypothetical protein I303_03781 [Kwoniella dejecticola CBS 10117]